MRITVKLIGGLVHTVGFGEREQQVPPGTTVAALLAGLGIGHFRSLVTTRNGAGIAREEEICDGDRILISPPFSGG